MLLILPECPKCEGGWIILHATVHIHTLYKPLTPPCVVYKWIAIYDRVSSCRNVHTQKIDHNSIMQLYEIRPSNPIPVCILALSQLIGLFAGTLRQRGLTLARSHYTRSVTLFEVTKPWGQDCLDPLSSISPVSTYHCNCYINKSISQCPHSRHLSCGGLHKQGRTANGAAYM